MSVNVNTTPLKRPVKFISLQTKLIVGFTLIFTIVFASTYYWFYTFARDEALFQIKEGLYDTIKGATETGILNDKDTVQYINGDNMEKLISEGTIRADGLSDDPLYWEQINTLCAIRRIEPRASLYTYIPSEKPGYLIFITSWGWCTEGATSDNFATFKQEIEFDNVVPNIEGLNQIVFQNDSEQSWCTHEDPSCTPELYTDPYGSWVSAYAPIKNSDGKTVAALGVDFKASYVNQVQREILNKIYFAFGITYAILILLVYFVAQTLTRPMSGLAKAAEQIGEGNYEVGIKYLSELNLSEKYPDEIETLQRVFNGMIDKVYKREQNLRKEVEKLKIQIDEGKRKKQVEEIVDSEFFQAIRDKASEIRKKNKGE